MSAESLRPARRTDVPRPPRVQRRALATNWDALAFAQLSSIRKLAVELLQPRGNDRLTEAVLTAVLGTIVWSGVTKRDLWTGLVCARRDELDLEAGVLVLRLIEAPGSGDQSAVHRERFPLHPISRLLWGRLLLVCHDDAQDTGRSEDWLLPAAWREPARLRAASVEWVHRSGFRRWSTFLGAVRLMHLFGTLLPVSVGRRAGRLVTSPVPASHWRRMNWAVSDDIEAEGRPECRQPLRERKRLLPEVPPWRQAMQLALAGLDGETDREVRDRMARSLEQLREDPDWSIQAGTMGRLVCEWAIQLLRRARQYRPNTARAWLARVGRAIDAGRLTDELLGPPLQTRAITLIRSILTLYTRGESQRALRTALRQFLGFAAHQGFSVPRVPWSHPELAVRGDARSMPLLPPCEVRTVVDTLRDTGREGLALAVATVLGAFGGLRRFEICWLSADDVPSDCRWTVRISRSKTATGRRFVPLGLLVPPWALNVLDEYQGSRSGRGPRSGVWLLTERGLRWDPDALGERVGRELQRVAGRRVTFHTLRRSCATWWLMRWVVSQADLPAPPVLADGPPAAGVTAVLGEDPAHVLWALARLLGHASPSVTVSRYVLGLDWIESQSLAGTEDLALPWPVISGLLLVSERRARQLVPLIRGPCSSRRRVWSRGPRRTMKA